MAYTGKTWRLPFDRGGLNHNSNIDNIPSEMMVYPSRNINLHEGGRSKRGGTAKDNDGGTAISGSPRVMGLYDFLLKDGTQFIVVAADGKIWKDYTNTIKTGLTDNKVTSMVSGDDLLFVCNGVNIPQTWNGAAASTSDITGIPTDWTGSSYPKQMVIHGRGVSERMWAFGCADNPYTVYASDNGAFQDFSDANVTTIDINTGDGIGIVGGVEFGDRLICFSKTRSFIIDDEDASTANWGYQGAQWRGGVASHRLIVETPNDVVCMMEDGDIYSVSAADTYGDYKKASIARPAFMDNWIREHIKLSAIDDFHAIYDPTLRAIKFFMVYSGQTNVQMALVYFIDRPPAEAWVPHDNQSYNSGYSASCSGLVRVGAGDYKIYTGDYSGFVWTLENVNKNDDSNGYYAGFKTPKDPYNESRTWKNYHRGHIITQPEGSYDLSITIWVDDDEKVTHTVSLAGTGGVLGSFTLGTDVLGGQTLVAEEYGIGYNGRRIQKEIFNTNANEDFFISEDLTDFRPLGVLT